VFSPVSGGDFAIAPIYEYTCRVVGAGGPCAVPCLRPWTC
jgi:hypothetical protein